MKIRLALSVLIALALMVPVADSAATPASDAGNHVVIAKKKKKQRAGAWCTKQAKKAPWQKYRLRSKVKSAKAYLYVNKDKSSYFFCSESPKFSVAKDLWAGFAKTGKLLAVRKNCAVFYSETKPGDNDANGVKEVWNIAYNGYRPGSATYLTPELTSQPLGFGADRLKLERLTLSKNCMWVAGYVENDKPTIGMKGTGINARRHFIELVKPGMTIPELRAINTTVLGPSAARISWTEGGVPKSVDYPGPYG